MEIEEWEDDESEIGTCRNCGREKIPIRYLVHPFVEEGICDAPKEPQPYCKYCYEEELRDI